MKQYLLVYGSISPSHKRPSKPFVAIEFDGTSATLNGEERAVKYWSAVIASSLAIASSIRDNQVDISRYVNRNYLLDVDAFDESEYEKYKDLFTSVKGTTNKIELERIPTVNEPDFSREKVVKFQERGRELMKKIKQEKKSG